MTTPSPAASIFEKSLTALGTQQAIANVNSIMGIADCTSPRGVYITELYSALNNRLLFKQIHPGRAPFVAIINGSYAWSIESNTNRPETLDPHSRAMIQGHDFLMLPLTLAQRFTHPEVIAVTNFAGNQCRQVNARDSLGLPSELYFEVATYQLTGIILANPIGQEGEKVQIHFTAWQKFTEINLPKTVTIKDKSGDFLFAFRTVQLNTVDESIFAIPSSISRLF